MPGFLQNRGQPLPDEVGETARSPRRLVLRGTILPLFQLDLRLYHDGIMEQKAIMSTNPRKGPVNKSPRARGKRSESGWSFNRSGAEWRTLHSPGLPARSRAGLPSEMPRRSLVGMTLTLQLPDRVAATLTGAWDDLPRATLESLAVEGYRSGKLSCAEVGHLLGHTSRWESEEFLASRGVWPGVTAGELQSDLATLDRLREA